jgi:hypothetical protein
MLAAAGDVVEQPRRPAAVQHLSPDRHAGAAERLQRVVLDR